MALEHDEPVVATDERVVGTDHVVGMTRADVGLGRMLALVVGVYFILVGAWALISGGISSLQTPVTTYLGLTGTPLTAIIHIGLGVLSLAGVAGWGFARGMDSLLGAMFTFAAIIVFANPAVLSNWLGLSFNNAVIYLLAGAAEFTGALLTPGGMLYRRTVTTT